jgi:hypothetical protein
MTRVVMKPMTVVEHIEIETTGQKLYPMAQAAALLGLTLPALRAQTWRGRIRTVKLGRRTMVSASEIARIQELSA